ncbi:hypothetical protein Sste5346_004653 [Sporothrix stenoceras]|uniref:RED-like N-terminal domain-containing protein n=1 Tax=Sporothrix stenoceras TaxID=5173 RepID=A0ABR3Z7H5_9PEZI
MNNDQFRKLALGAGASSGSKNGASTSMNSSNNGATPGAPRALGSRQKASIPMTPRYGSDVSRMAFAKQMADRYNNGDDDKKKKMRTSNPKGSKFAAGYVDRAKMRSEQETDENDRAVRLAALEELHKKGEVEQAVYEKLRFEIAGGDLSSTHLVKGLDFKLLNRVRMGEDVFGGEKKDDDDKEEDKEPAPPATDVDDEFEKIEGSEVQAVEREKAKKKGQYSTTTTAAAGQKRSRDQILAEMKAAREAAKQAKAAASEPLLSSRFKKIGAPQTAGSRIEIDSRGREVLVIVDEDGHEKRKVRKTAPPAADGVDALKADGKVLGMEVPEFYRKKQEAEAAAAAAKEVDIFDDVGSDYDPLAGMDSESSDDDSDEDGKKTEKKQENEEKEDSRDAKRRRRSSTTSSREDGEASDTSSTSRDSRRRRRSTSRERRPAEPAKPRNNYFGGSTLLSEQSSRGGPSLNDPSVLAALRKAKQMREASESEAKSQALSKEAEREARLKKLMQSSDRDAEDLDMGFGTNRLEDTEDLDEDRADRKERLSTWRGGADAGGDDDDDEEGGSRGDKTKRKRGGKKRKGDGNNAEDVMRVLERRKEAS